MACVDVPASSTACGLQLGLRGWCVVTHLGPGVLIRPWQSAAVLDGNSQAHGLAGGQAAA